MARLTLENISKVWRNGGQALESFDLDLEDGEMVALLGPSGCGKSTTLRLIAGLESPTTGEIRIGGRRVNDLPPRARRVAMVFQENTLYPWLTARENLAFPKRLRGEARSELEKRIDSIADKLDITRVLSRRPHQLSGGERQRVALGHCLLRAADVYLFDEPLAHVDAQLRAPLRSEIARLHREENRTGLWVTHDQGEALALADRVVVLSEGRIHQIARPDDLWREPANAFVAGFIGNPPRSLLRGRLVDSEAGLRFDPHGLDMPLSERFPNGADLEVHLAIPADGLTPVSESRKDEHCIEATLERIEPTGLDDHLYLRHGEHRFICRGARGTGHSVGYELCLRVEADRLRVFDAETGEALSPSVASS